MTNYESRFASIDCSSHQTLQHFHTFDLIKGSVLWGTMSSHNIHSCTELSQSCKKCLRAPAHAVVRNVLGLSGMIYERA